MFNQIPLQEDPNKPLVIYDISSEMMYVCPNCGRVITFNQSASAKCPACGSETLPQDSARCEINANKSHFARVLNYSEGVRQIPGLDFLSNRTLDISILSAPIAAHQTYWLQSHSTLSDDAVEFTAQEIEKGLHKQREILHAILSIPNNYWFITTEPGKTRSSVFFSHPNGSFTCLSIIHNTHYREEWINVDIRRFNNPPRTQKELKDIFDGFPSINDQIVSSASTPHISVYKPDPIYHLRKPEYGLLLENLRVQQEEVYVSIITKLKQTIQERNGVEVLLDEPKTNPEKQMIINQNMYIDNQLKSGMAIACASCGSPITGYDNQVSFLRCPRCLHITDLVGSGRLSPELLTSRKPSETFIPADYFLQLLANVEKNGGPKASRIIELLSRNSQSLNSIEQTEFLDTISWIAYLYPYLMSFYRFKTNYEDYPSHTGGVLNIIFTDSSSISNGAVMGGSEYLDFKVPEDLQGKVLSISFGDFANGAPQEPNENWCRVMCKLFDSFDFDERFEGNVDSWGHQLVYGDNRDSEQHWCESFNKYACSGFNKPVDGPIFNRIGLAMQKMPPNNFFLNSRR